MSLPKSNSALPVAREDTIDLCEFSSGVVVGFTENGECVLRGFGEISVNAAENIAIKLTLLASRLRSYGAPPARQHLH